MNKKPQDQKKVQATTNLLPETKAWIMGEANHYTVAEAEFIRMIIVDYKEEVDTKQKTVKAMIKKHKNLI